MTRGFVVPREVHRVTGDAPLRFLHAVLSQDVETLPAGASVDAAYLDQNAHVLAEIRVTHTSAGEIWLDAEPAAADTLAHLAKVAPLSGCEVADESGAFVFTVTPETSPTAFSESEGAVRIPSAGGYDTLAPGAPPDAWDLEGFSEHCVVAGRARFGIDITPEMFVFETPLLMRAVSRDKGCYPGQESVARTVNLGSPKRSLVHLHLDGPAPEPGSAVRSDGREAGVVTSSARDRAIALVRSDVSEGSAVAVGDVRGTVRPLY